MAKYKVVVKGKNIFGKQTFSSRREALDNIRWTNQGAKILGQRSAALGSRIITIGRKRRYR